MRISYPLIFSAWLGLGISTALALPEANWDRESALAVARSHDLTTTRQSLLNLTISGSTVDVLDLLQDVSARPDVPGPARDYLVYAFAQDLRGLPASAVAHEVITWLKAYQPNTLIPHEDHPRAAVPLFNVRAAAAGVEHGWLRQDAMLEGMALLKSNPRALVDVYLIETHTAARLGYLATLEQASPAQLAMLSKFATRRLAARPELTPLAGRSALLAGDLAALEDVIVHGEGPALAHLMRQAAQRLDSSDGARLMEAAIRQSGPINASLAIAELGPVVSREPVAQALLLDQLGSPELGGAAAIALARSPSPQIRQALDKVKTSGDELSATRARMALNYVAETEGGLE